MKRKWVWKHRDWEPAFAIMEGGRRIWRFVYSGSCVPGMYQGRKITDKNMKAKRRRQIERGQLTEANGLTRESTSQRRAA